MSSESAKRYYTAVLLEKKVKKNGDIVWIGEVLYDLKKGDTLFFNAMDIEKGFAKGRIEWQPTTTS